MKNRGSRFDRAVGIWFLSRMFDFRGSTLAEAIEKTFENRNTPITVNPTVFDLSFTKDEDKKVQWLGFINKDKIADAPESFENVAAAVKVFLEPIVASIVERQTFHGIWTAPGPWQSQAHFRSFFQMNTIRKSVFQRLCLSFF